MTVSERINAERVVLLAWSRAILLQIAHPLIAAGVADHSSFQSSALAPVARLHHTIRAMLSLTYGTDAQRERTLAGINAIHRRVNGALREDVGPYPAGTRYSAEDPALLLWVHATLLESMAVVYEMLVGPLTTAERDAYCRETIPTVHALGVREGAPESWMELGAMIDRTYRSGAITVGRDARRLGHAVVSPPFGWAVAPARRLNYLFAAGLLPEHVRTQYGFPWGEREERAFARSAAFVRGVRRLLPRRLALWPEARR